MQWQFALHGSVLRSIDKSLTAGTLLYFSKVVVYLAGLTVPQYGYLHKEFLVSQPTG